jgi:hypothetical protein
MKTAVKEFVGKKAIPTQKLTTVPWVCSPQSSHCNDHMIPAPGPEHRTAENYTEGEILSLTSVNETGF